MWKAWADLDNPSRVGRLTDPGETYRWAVPVRTLRSDTRAISLLLRHHPEALDALVIVADCEPSDNDDDLHLTGDAKRYIRDRLESSPVELIGLAHLSDHDTLPRRLNIDAWYALITSAPDNVVLATGYLISREAPEEHWEIATLTMAGLYANLAAGNATDAWRRLEPHLRGDRSTWDRCGRLAVDFAGVVRRYGDDAKTRSVRMLEQLNKTAADALEGPLSSARSKKFKLLDPTTWI
jgi:hypothetical protein